MLALSKSNTCYNFQLAKLANLLHSFDNIFISISWHHILVGCNYRFESMWKLKGTREIKKIIRNFLFKIGIARIHQLFSRAMHRRWFHSLVAMVKNETEINKCCWDNELITLWFLWNCWKQTVNTWMKMFIVYWLELEWTFKFRLFRLSSRFSSVLLWFFFFARKEIHRHKWAHNLMSVIPTILWKFHYKWWRPNVTLRPKKNPSFTAF